MVFSPTDLKIRPQSPGLGCRDQERGAESQVWGAEPSPSIHPNTPAPRAAPFPSGAAAELRSLFLLGGTIKQHQSHLSPLEKGVPQPSGGLSPRCCQGPRHSNPNCSSQSTGTDLATTPPSPLQSPDVPVQLPAISLLVLPPCPAPDPRARRAEPGLNSAQR